MSPRCNAAIQKLCMCLVLPLITVGISFARAEEPPCAGNELVTAKGSMATAKLALDKAIADIDKADSAHVKRLELWFGVRSSADAATVKQILVGSRAYLDGASFMCSFKSDAKLGDYYAN